MGALTIISCVAMICMTICYGIWVSNRAVDENIVNRWLNELRKLEDRVSKLEEGR